MARRAKVRRQVWKLIERPDNSVGFLDRSLADAEPKALRYRILHTAVRLVRG